MIKKILAIIIPVIIITISISLIFTYFSKPHKKIIFGTLLGGISTLDVIEYKKSYFENKYGVEIEIRKFEKTLDIATALSKGEIDIAVIPAEFVAKIWEKGDKAYIIAVDMLQNQAIISKKRISIQNLTKLRIGVFKPTGTFAMFRSYMRLIYGINVDKLNLIDSPPPILIKGFEKCEIDVIVIWEPYVSKLLAKGYYVIETYESLWKKLYPNYYPVMIVYAARNDLNPDLVKVTKDMRIEAAKIWNSNKTLIVMILKKYYRLNDKEIEILYKRVRIIDKPLDNKFVESIRKVWELAWKGGYLSQKPEYQAFYVQ